MKIYLNFVFVGDEIWMIKITIQTSARVILGSRKRKKKKPICGKDYEQTTNVIVRSI